MLGSDNCCGGSEGKGMRVRSHARGFDLRALAKRATIRRLHGRHADAAVAMVHEDRREAVDLLLEPSDIVYQSLVVHGERLDLVLELVEPGLLALAALESS